MSIYISNEATNHAASTLCVSLGNSAAHFGSSFAITSSWLMCIRLRMRCYLFVSYYSRALAAVCDVVVMYSESLVRLHRLACGNDDACATLSCMNLARLCFSKHFSHVREMQCEGMQCVGK